MVAAAVLVGVGVAAAAVVMAVVVVMRMITKTGVTLIVLMEKNFDDKNDATCIVPVDIYGEAGRGGEEEAPREEEEGGGGKRRNQLRDPPV